MELLHFLKELGHTQGDYSDSVLEAESRLGINFAEEYRNLLINLGQFEIDIHEYTGVVLENYLNIVSATEEERQYTHPSTRSMYVIEYLGFDGIVIWQDTAGKIYQTVPNKDIEPEQLYDSFGQYITSEVLP